MNEEIIKETINKIFKNVFDCDNPFTLDEILNKFAFDIKLPQEVKDSVSGEITWATSTNPTKFLKDLDSLKKDTWMFQKRDIESLEELVGLWNQINYRTTERVYNSENVLNSDTIYSSQNVYRSCDSNECKYIIFCDGCHHSEYLLASQRSGNSNFCIRVDDSGNCSNSYNVSCSGKISNSFFIEDCNSLYECMFCAHIQNKRFCIANMQFEEDEYYQIKKEIIKWIMNS